jgi:hypothetical protein
MTDADVLKRINELADEEQHIHASARAGEGLTEADHAKLDKIEVALDQCWDLLRQRRAKRRSGENADEAHLRDPGTVETYLQ